MTGHPVLAVQFFQHFSVLLLYGLRRSYRGNRTATKCTLRLELQVRVKITLTRFRITTLSDSVSPLSCCRAEARASHMQGPGAHLAVLKCAPLMSVFTYSPFMLSPSPIDIFILVLHPPLFMCIWFLTLNSPCLVLLICYCDGLLLCNPSWPRTSGNPPSSFSRVIAMYL